MAKRGAKRKQKASVMRNPPTPEQLARGEYHSAGMAYKRIPVIDTMLARDQITPQEHVRLAYYRDQASLAERSEIKSCLDFSVKGGDLSPPAAITSAILETARIERDLGSLREITRAVAVDDVSITEWCIAKHGGRERYNSKGEFVAMVPIREIEVMDMALMDLKMASRRITP